MNSPKRQNIKQGIASAMQYVVGNCLKRRGGDRPGAGIKDQAHVEQCRHSKDNESHHFGNWLYLMELHPSLKREGVHDPADQDRKQYEGAKEIKKVFYPLSCFILR
jgi:hypothetical protein